MQRINALARAFVWSLIPGNGRPHRCKIDELSERLSTDGITCTPDELSDALARLEDVGLLVRVQKQPPSPLFVVLNSRDPYDQRVSLAADVCSVIKRRGDQFESDQELCSWLDQDQVNYTPESLSAALHHLERIGRIKRPRQDQWSVESPLPGTYVEPRIHAEIF
jgi:DNA-binding HxlR family transcriptional regulator